MRQILVDHARRRTARKRDGGAAVVGVDDPLSPATALVDILSLDRALDELAAVDERMCRIVEQRFFAGLNIEETAEALGISRATVERDWAVAKAWLFKRLS
jgi:RNA polymerase sigma factor (TIGR02999 family)